MSREPGHTYSFLVPELPWHKDKVDINIVISDGEEQHWYREEVKPRKTVGHPRMDNFVPRGKE